jgi:hypothetical protein
MPVAQAEVLSVVPAELHFAAESMRADCCPLAAKPCRQHSRPSRQRAMKE